eukprot:g686.t1
MASELELEDLFLDDISAIDIPGPDIGETSLAEFYNTTVWEEQPLGDDRRNYSPSHLRRTNTRGRNIDIRSQIYTISQRSGLYDIAHDFSREVRDVFDNSVFHDENFDTNATTPRRMSRRRYNFRRRKTRQRRDSKRRSIGDFKFTNGVLFCQPRGLKFKKVLKPKTNNGQRDPQSSKTDVKLNVGDGLEETGVYQSGMPVHRCLPNPLRSLFTFFYNGFIVGKKNGKNERKEGEHPANKSIDNIMKRMKESTVRIVSSFEGHYHCSDRSTNGRELTKQLISQSKNMEILPNDDAEGKAQLDDKVHEVRWNLESAKNCATFFIHDFFGPAKLEFFLAFDHPGIVKDVSIEGPVLFQNKATADIMERSHNRSNILSRHRVQRRKCEVIGSSSLHLHDVIQRGDIGSANFADLFELINELDVEKLSQLGNVFTAMLLQSIEFGTRKMVPRHPGMRKLFLLVEPQSSKSILCPHKGNSDYYLDIFLEIDCIFLKFGENESHFTLPYPHPLQMPKIVRENLPPGIDINIRPYEKVNAILKQGISAKTPLKMASIHYLAISHSTNLLQGLFDGSRYLYKADSKVDLTKTTSNGIRAIDLAAAFGDANLLWRFIPKIPSVWVNAKTRLTPHSFVLQARNCYSRDLIAFRSSPLDFDGQKRVQVKQSKVELFLRDGLPLCTQGWTLLHYGVYSGSLPTVKSIYRSAASLLNIKSDPKSDALTPFLLACALGEIKIVQFLAQQGIRISRRPDTAHGQRTALMLAARFGEYAIVQFLVGREADVNSKCDGGYTALHYACLCNLTKESRENAAKIVKYLIGVGSKIECCNQGRSPLHIAILSGNLEVASVLLTHAKHCFKESHFKKDAYGYSVVDLAKGQQYFHLLPIITQICHTLNAQPLNASMEEESIMQFSCIEEKVEEQIETKVDIQDSNTNPAVEILTVGSSPTHATISKKLEDFFSSNKALSVSSNASTHSSSSLEFDSVFNTEENDNFDYDGVMVSSCTAEDILATCQTKIKKVMAQTNLDERVCGTLLALNEWIPERTIDKYRSTNNDVSKEGDTDDIVNQINDSFCKDVSSFSGYCDCCMEDDLSIDQCVSLSCGHWYCKACWLQYLLSRCSAVDAPEAILRTQCPHTKCQKLLSLDCWEEILKILKEYSESTIDESSDAEIYAMLDQLQSTQFAGLLPYFQSNMDDPNAREILRSLLNGGNTVPLLSTVGSQKDTSALSSVNVSQTSKDYKRLESLFRKHRIQQYVGSRQSSSRWCSHPDCPWKLHDETTGGFYKCLLVNPSSRIESNSLKQVADDSSVIRVAYFLDRIRRTQTRLAEIEQHLSIISQMTQTVDSSSPSFRNPSRKTSFSSQSQRSLRKSNSKDDYDWQRAMKANNPAVPSYLAQLKPRTPQWSIIIDALTSICSNYQIIKSVYPSLYILNDYYQKRFSPKTERSEKEKEITNEKRHGNPVEENDACAENNNYAKNVDTSGIVITIERDDKHEGGGNGKGPKDGHHGSSSKLYERESEAEKDHAVVEKVKMESEETNSLPIAAGTIDQNDGERCRIEILLFRLEQLDTSLRKLHADIMVPSSRSSSSSSSSSSSARRSNSEFYSIHHQRHLLDNSVECLLRDIVKDLDRVRSSHKSTIKNKY